MADNAKILKLNDTAQETNGTFLSDVVELAKKEREENASVDMERIADEVQVNPDAELESSTVITDIGDESVIDLIAKDVEEYTPLDIDILDVNDETVEKAVEELTVSNAKENFNLSDEEAIAFLNIVRNINEPGVKVYPMLPDSVKEVVNSLMAQNGIAIQHREKITRHILKEMMNDAGVEQAFVDFEKSLNEALNMPSIVDMYSEHTKETMDVRIPEMIEKIKDIAPEKAEKLQAIRNEFKKAYTFEEAVNFYERSSYIRKAVRRYDFEFMRSLRNLNFRNQKSTFMFNDATEMPSALTSVLIINPLSNVTENDTLKKRLIDMKITDIDIKKFCVLIAKTCEGKDSTNVMDAAYMYYLLRNIITLKLTHEAKTDFAVELINNICDVITFIRNKEADLNATNLDKPKSAKKLRNGKSAKA